MLLFLDSGILQPIEYDVVLGDSQSYVVKPRTFYLIYWEIHSRALSSLVMSNYLDITIQERSHVGFRADSPRQICPSAIPGHVPELWMKMPSWKWGLWSQLLLLPAVWIIPAQTLWGREEYPCCTLSKFLTQKTHIGYCFMSILVHLSCCIKVPQTGCLRNRNLFLPALDPEKSEIKEPVDSVGRDPPPGP